VAAAGYLQDAFNRNHQLINTNTLLTETVMGTISVGSKLRRLRLTGSLTQAI
jgi:hypothetical protein